jgi:predicted DNA-binding transcriptional regulator YafY
MERTERFYKIQQLLQSRRFVRTQDFLDELEVSRATFKRDLEYLRDRFRAPIVYDPEHEAYRFDDKVEDSAVWQLPGLWFTADELVALLTTDRLLADLAPGVLSELIGPFRKRIQALLAAGELSAEDVTRRIRVLAMGSRSIEPAHFRTLATALLSRRRVKIRHNRRQDGEVLEREVSPQRLVHYRDNWYLDAYCHKRQSLRTFAVDAIEQAIVLDKAAKDVADDSLDRHFASGYGIFAGADTEQAVLLFNPAAARRQLRAQVPVLSRTRAGDGHPQVRCGRRSAGARVAARGCCRAAVTGDEALPEVTPGCSAPRFGRRA